ncbi:translocation/assembly module TamB domain-containing protein [Azonexus sp.]|uniref:translocation/assembly module TamB domain-containing protein n=1 Tax=Azonexus sp. TaxID=1872668 RepID=UPI0035AD8212
MRRTALILPVALAGLAAAGGWLAGSDSGLRAVAALAEQAAGGRLRIEAPRGRLAGPLQIGALRWQTPDLELAAEEVALDWTPSALWDGRLQLVALHAGRIAVRPAAGRPPLPPPADLTLPFAVDAPDIAISALRYDGVELDGLAAGFASDGRTHRLSGLRGRFGDVTLAGEASLDGAAPTVAARLDVRGEIADRPLRAELSAHGPLTRIAVEAVAREGVDGRADAVITPYAATPFASARIALDALDPAAWHAAAPAARLALKADLRPAGDGVAGRFAVENSRSGPVDRDRLPLDSLRGELDWQGDGIDFRGLLARLPGGGELAGRGAWRGAALELALSARRIDAARIVSTLRPTRLDGRIAAGLSGERQTLDLDLSDARFALRAEAALAGDRVDLARAELSAGDARLSARGELQLSGERPFRGEGELRHFDPARFGDWPAARLNATLQASGRLAPHARIDAGFALRDSEFAGQPLTGRGSVAIDWPRLPRVDIELAAGPNRLAARGAFGRPDEVLSGEIAAPQLAPYGLEGGLAGDFALSGGVDRARLKLRLDSERLGRPGRFRIDGLRLAADASLDPAAPLALDLAIARLDLDGQLIRRLQLAGSGSRQAHRLQASAVLPGRHRPRVAVDGGLDADFRWQGRLTEAVLEAPEAARHVRLLEPAALRAGADGWSLGPARLGGDALDWRATLQAAADAKRLRARIDATGSRIGRIDGELDAAMESPWALARRSPWRGRLRAEVPDLGWIGELLGEGWQSGGRLSGELTLAGTPQAPLGDGRLSGRELALRLPEQGLQLVDGELSARLAGNRLELDRLGFASLLQPPPRALRRQAGDALPAGPGRVDISGRAGVDRGREYAEFDIVLDRFGAWQLPEQWIALSGRGRLGWQDGTLLARGGLNVDAGYWQFAPGGTPQLSDDVVVRRPGVQATTAAPRPTLDIDVTTGLGGHFLFSGAGLSSRLAGDIRISARGRDLPRAGGTIRMVDGRFDAYGQQLDIERGNLHFRGLLDNPALDVRAMRRGPAVEAGVEVGGNAKKPVVRLVSEPEVPDAEKLSWLVLGHGSEQMGSGDATVLLSAAGGLLGNDAGGLVQQLKRGFGIDELGVRQGDIGGSGGRLPTSRVAGSGFDAGASTGQQIFSIGKRLSANALLSYEQALGRAESVVKLTVDLSRQVSVVGRAGSDNALDVFYTLSFPREPRTKP